MMKYYAIDLCNSHETSYQLHDPCNNNDDDSGDEDVTSAYYRQNCSNPGRILYTVSYYKYGGINNSFAILLV